MDVYIYVFTIMYVYIYIYMHLRINNSIIPTERLKIIMEKFT